MSIQILLLTALGAGLGALLGALKSCPDGGCPLTANPWRGAIWGGILGLFIGVSSSEGIRAEPNAGPVSMKASWREVATPEDFQREVLDQQGVTVVYFHADWCGACRNYGPILRQVAEDTADRARYVSVDADAAETLAREYQIAALPTTLFFSKGRLLGRLVGGVPEGTLLNAIAKAEQEGAGEGMTQRENANVLQ